MSALNTKYRPTGFDDVLGQEHVITSLRRVVDGARAHTFLFVGPAGTGKTTLARILANMFAGGKATAANLDEVAAADNTGVSDMRDIIKRSMFKAVGASPIKAIILDEAHRLSANAWDALLKPIEEPPKHVYWMLCTTNLSKVPTTIQTRCLRYELKPVSEELLAELLVKVADAEGFDTPDVVLEAIAETAAGSPRQALVFLEACAYAKSAADAQVMMRSAGKSKEVIDLCRWLVGSQGKSWNEAIKYVKALEGNDAESIRISVVNYLSAVLMNTKSEAKAVPLLRLLEIFEGPYNASDKLAPLLLALGLALNLNGG